MFPWRVIVASFFVVPPLFTSCAAPPVEPRAEPGNDFEVRWAESLGLTGRADVPNRLSEPWGYSLDVYRLDETRGRETASMSDCVSYFRLSDAGFEARPIHEQLDLGADCHAIRAIGEATASRASHLEGFRLDERSVELLPPDLSLIVSDDDARRVETANAAGHAWSQVEPIGSVTVERSGAILVEGDGWGVRVALLTWGDFDGDGVEDVVAKLGGWLTEGSYRTTRLVVLTRPEAGARLKLVREYDLP